MFSVLVLRGRLFGLMQQPIIRALRRRHGIGGGLVYLNPTESFNLYLGVTPVLGLFAASPFVSINSGSLRVVLKALYVRENYFYQSGNKTGLEPFSSGWSKIKRKRSGAQ